MGSLPRSFPERFSTVERFFFTTLRICNSSNSSSNRNAFSLSNSITVEKKEKVINKESKTLKNYETKLQKLQTTEEKEEFLKAKREKLRNEINDKEEEIYTINQLLDELKIV